MNSRAQSHRFLLVVFAIASMMLSSGTGIKAQDDDPFGFPGDAPAGDPFGSSETKEFGSSETKEKEMQKEEKESAVEKELTDLKEANKKNYEKEKTEIKNLLKSLAPQLSEKDLEKLGRFLDEGAERRAELAKELLEQKIETLEYRDFRTSQFENLRDDMKELHQELEFAEEMAASNERELREQQADLERELREQQAGLVILQQWFAHAVESVDQPELQRWVLSRLKTSPELTRLLTERPTPRDEVESLRQSRELEDAVRKLARQEGHELQSLALQVARIIDPDAISSEPVSTTRWPIVAQEGHNREQQILETLDTIGPIEFFEIYLRDATNFFEDVYEISILIDDSVSQKFPNEDEPLLDLYEKKISLRVGLEKLLSPHGLTYQVKDESLIIVTEEFARQNPVRRLYDVAVYRGAETPEDLAKTLSEAIDSPTLKVLPTGTRLIVIGSEQEHFELSKMLTLLNLSASVEPEPVPVEK